MGRFALIPGVPTLAAWLKNPAAVFLLPLPRTEVAALPMPNAVLVLLLPVESITSGSPAAPRPTKPVEDAVLFRPIAVFLLPSPAPTRVAALPMPSAVETLPVPASAEAVLFRPIANAPLPALACAVLPGNRARAQEPCPVAEQLSSPILPTPPIAAHAAFAVPADKPQNVEANAPVAMAPTTAFPAVEAP